MSDPSRSDTNAETVLLLGAGERSSELALAFRRLGADVVTVSDHGETPALAALIDARKPRYVVADAATVATDALIAVAERDDVEVFPTPRATRIPGPPPRPPHPPPPPTPRRRRGTTR